MEPTTSREADDVAARLATECAVIRTLLAQAVRDEVATRYRIGVRVCVVKRAPDRFGKHGVEWLASQLGLGRGTLYRYAAVAENWTDAELRALATRLTPQGEPLSWSHMVALTRVLGRGSRRRLASTCISAGWTVRELTKQIDELGTPESHDDPELENSHEGGDPVQVALVDGIQTAARFGVQLDVFLEALEDRLTNTEGDDTLVSRAIGAFEALQGKVDASLGTLRRARSSSRLRIPFTAQHVAADVVEPQLPMDDDYDAVDNEPLRARLRADR